METGLIIFCRKQIAAPKARVLRPGILAQERKAVIAFGERCLKTKKALINIKVFQKW